MKKILLQFVIISSALFTPFLIHAQNVGINSTGSAPDPSAMLDVSSTSSGMLIPRMIENQRTAITSPATGLLVYQTDDTTGFYYFDGTAWRLIGSGLGWELTGNSGTTPGANFIGTTDANDFVFKTNGSENMRLANSSGNLVLGSGDGTGTVTGNTLRASNGTGTNITGANLTITSGNGTGTGGSGNLIFQTASIGSTGSTANTMSERLRITSSGYVGIGTTNPASIFSIGLTSQFQVNSSGDIISIKGVTYSWPSSNPGSGNLRIMKNDGSGNLSWVTPNSTLSTSNVTSSTSGVTVGNGTGQVVGASNLTIDIATNSSSSPGLVSAGSGNNNKAWITDGSGNPSWKAVDLTTDITNTLPISNGGTGLSTTPTNGQILIGNGTGYTLATINTSGPGLSITNAAGNITLTNAGVTANNGLFMNTSTNLQLGGTLLQTTTITQASYDLIHNLSGTGNFRVQNSGSDALDILSSTGNVVIGSGEATGTVAGNTLRAPNAIGTNVAGANFTLSSGDGTGTGGSGSIIFQTAPVGATGTTANAMTERMRLTTTGALSFSGAANYGSSGSMLQSSGNSTPAWSTATYPSTTTANQMLYSSANNVVAGLSAGTNGQVLTMSGGVPTWAAASANLSNLTPGTGLTGSAYNGSAAETFGVSYGSAAGTAVQGNTTLTISPGTGMSGGGTITLGTGASVTLNNTGVTSVTASSPLSSSGGTTPNISLTGIVPIPNGGTDLSTTPTNGQLLIGNGTGYTLGTITAGTGMSVTNASGSITLANTGVTSVGLSLPNIFTVTNSPVTTTGTLTGTLATQTANTVFAGPASGGAATPTFRALVAADIPAGSITANNGLMINSGNNVQLGGTLIENTTISQWDYNLISNLTGTGNFEVQENGVNDFVVNGSTGNVGIGIATPAQALQVVGNVQFSQALMPGGASGSTGNILLSAGTGAAPTWLANGANGQVLTLSGGVPTWAGASANLLNLTPGTGLTGSAYNGSAAETFAVNYGSAAGSAVQGNTTLTVSPGTGMSGGGTITLGTGGTVTLNNTGVTSVGLSLPSIFIVTNSPVTTTGTLTGSLATQTANTVFAGPTSGGAAAPTFRALVAADMPSGIVTANNGLTVNTGNNVQLGGTLIQNTTLTQGSYDLIGNLSGTGNFRVQNNGTDAFGVRNSTGNVVIGSGEATGTVAGNTLRAPNATGTNVAGANFTLTSGDGTGTGGSGGIIFQTAPVGATGTTANTMTERMRLTATGALAFSGAANYGASGSMLQSTGNATPAWSTATYPTTTTNNQILYSSATNTVTGLGIIDDGVLTTSATGVPTWLSAGTNGYVLTMVSGVPTWAAAGSGYVTNVTASAPLSSSGGTTPNISLTGIVPVANGGTGQSSLTSNGIIYGNSTSPVGVTPAGTEAELLTANTSGNPAWTSAATAGEMLTLGTSGAFQWIPAASVGEVLTFSSSGIPVWSTQGTSGQIMSISTSGLVQWTPQGNVGQVLTASTSDQPAWSSTGTAGEMLSIASSGGVTWTPSGTTGEVLSANSSGIPTWISGGSNGQVLTINSSGVAVWAAASSGVTSVGLSLPSIFTVTNSPVTSTGTLTGTLTNENANTVFAGPSSGGAATPTFRALVVADMPSGLVTANNGLTVNTGNNVQLGGTLIQATTITHATYDLIHNLTSTGNFRVQNNGIDAFAVRNSTGNVVIGSGEATGTVAGNTLRAPNATGTNVAGANFTLTSGDGTGTGGSGSIIFQTAPVGATGTTANTMTERMRLTATGALAFSGAANYGTSGSMLQSTGNATPAWSTATYPTTTAADQILYSSSTNTVTGLAAGSNGQVLTMVGGVPTWSAASSSAWNLTGNASTVPGTDFVGTTDANDLVFKTDGSENMRISNSTGNVVIGSGDGGGAGNIIRAPYASGGNSTGVNFTIAAGAPTGKAASGSIIFQTLAANVGSPGNTSDLSIMAEDMRITSTGALAFNGAANYGTSGSMLQSTGNATPAWSTATYPTTTMADQILYSSATNTVTGLAAGTNGQVLTMVAGVPTWSTSAASSAWNLTGNAGTTAGVNFIGTTDATDLEIKTGATPTERMHIVNSTGNVVIGSGEGTATATGNTLRAPNLVGTNLPGVDFTIAGGNGTGTGGGGDVVFQTSPIGASGTTANTLTERMRIAYTGNVIIGTGDGTRTVTGNILRGPNPVGTNIAGVDFTIAGGGGTGNGGGGDVVFQTAPAAASGTTANTLAERMRIMYTGNVGIGTATPSTLLQVNGTESLGTASSTTGTLQFNNSSNANTVSVSAGTTSTSYSLTLPTAAASSNGQVLSSTTTGTLSWATPPSTLLGIICDSTAGTTTPTLAAGTTWILVKCVGGGGAGGGIGKSSCTYETDEAGSGGGAGGYCEGFVTGITVGTTTISVTVGAGGAGAAGCNAVAANPGGNTTVTITSPAATLTAKGGYGGSTVETSGTATNLAGGVGGSASGGSINIAGANGGNAITSVTGTDVVFAGEGGSSMFGSGGQQQYTRDDVEYVGLSARAPGAGGGGAVAVQQTSNIATAGGSGAHGIVIIYEY